MVDMDGVPGGERIRAKRRERFHIGHRVRSRSGSERRRRSSAVRSRSSIAFSCAILSMVLVRTAHCPRRRGATRPRQAPPQRCPDARRAASASSGATFRYMGRSGFVRSLSWRRDTRNGPGAEGTYSSRARGATPRSAAEREISPARIAEGRGFAEAFSRMRGFIEHLLDMTVDAKRLASALSGLLLSLPREKDVVLISLS